MGTRWGAAVNPLLIGHPVSVSISSGDSWEEWLSGLDSETRSRAEEIRDSFVARGWESPESCARSEIVEGSPRWSPDEQLAYLAGLSAGLQRDVQATLDPSFVIEWFVDEEGGWSFRCFRSKSWFAELSDVGPPGSELQRQREIERVVFQVAYNMWPDEWTSAWPLCPVHRDHPLNPKMKHDRASWVCDRDARISATVGDLAGLNDDHS